MAAPPALNDDAIAEILLRLPPDEPACLVRAALVCKPWRRILSHPSFPRRYREFHRTPPLLGFLRNRRGRDPYPEFVPTADASPFYSPEFDCDRWWILDCRHGRALFRCLEPNGLVVWDPITGDEHYMIDQPDNDSPSLAAAVLCAVDGCDHLACHGGPFLVVVVADDFYMDVTWVSLYSSETDAWTFKKVYFDFPCDIEPISCLLDGSALYFLAASGLCLFKFDLALQELSIMETPEEYHDTWSGTVMTAEGGGLGLAGLKDHCLCLWSWQAGADGIEDWVQHRAINLETVLPMNGLSAFPRLVGFADGSNTIFVNKYDGIFAVELSSGQVRNIGDMGRTYSIIPYMSFYTPDLAEVILPNS